MRSCGRRGHCLYLTSLRVLILRAGIACARGKLRARCVRGPELHVGFVRAGRTRVVRPVFYHHLVIEHMLTDPSAFPGSSLFIACPLIVKRRIICYASCHIYALGGAGEDVERGGRAHA